MELTLKQFLVFIGSMAFCAVTFSVITSKVTEAFAVSGKKLFGYGALSTLLTAIAAFLASFATTDPFLIFWLLGLLFLISGIVHTNYVQKRFLQKKATLDFRVLLAAAMLGISIIAFSVIVFAGLQYFFKDRYFLFFPVLMSALLFFVPLLVWYSFMAGYAIPVTLYPTWQFPLQQGPEYPSDISRERMLVVGLELAKNEGDVKKTYFRAKVPETMKLGDFFFHFINDYNELHPNTAIAFMGTDFEPFSWLFHTKRKWYQSQKVLHPEFSLRENEVMENTIIVCERMALGRIVSNTYKSSYHEG
jgi:hypothetical protein